MQHKSTSPLQELFNCHFGVLEMSFTHTVFTWEVIFQPLKLICTDTQGNRLLSTHRIIYEGRSDAHTIQVINSSCYTALLINSLKKQNKIQHTNKSNWCQVIVFVYLLGGGTHWHPIKGCCVIVLRRGWRSLLGSLGKRPRHSTYPISPSLALSLFAVVGVVGLHLWLWFPQPLLSTLWFIAMDLRGRNTF